jgi:hypothetical protein
LFDAEGRLSQQLISQPLTVSFVEGLPAQTPKFILGPSLAEGGTGLDGVVAFAAPLALLQLAFTGSAPRVAESCPSRYAVTAVGQRPFDLVGQAEPKPVQWQQCRPQVITQRVELAGILDASSTVPSVAWDPREPNSTSNFSTNINIYDSAGQEHTLDVYFVKVAADRWKLHAVLPSTDVLDPAPLTGAAVTEICSADLVFGFGGALIGGGYTQCNYRVPVSPGIQSFTLLAGYPFNTGATGFNGMVQVASASSITDQYQDGCSYIPQGYCRCPNSR